MCSLGALSPQGLLERLRAGEIVLGDGGMICEMEKRCYVQTGFWTPEVCVTHPEAGEIRQHKLPVQSEPSHFTLTLPNIYLIPTYM